MNAPPDFKVLTSSLAVLAAGLVCGWLGVGAWIGSDRSGTDALRRPAAAPDAVETATVRTEVAAGDTGTPPTSAAGLEAEIRRLILESDEFAAVRIRRLLVSAGIAGTGHLPGLLETFGRNHPVAEALLQAWTELDPDAALRWVTADTLRRQKWEETLVRGWARKDLDAAWTWVMEQPLRAESWKTRAGLVEAAAEHDPADALTRMRDAGWLLTQRNALVRLFGVWGARDPFAALAAATETVRDLTGEPEPDGGGLFGQVLAGLMEGVILTDPSQVARLAEKLLEVRAGGAAGQLLAAWPDVVTQSAERWLSLPGGESLLADWVKHSGTESLNLVLDLPEGSLKQRLLGNSGELGSMPAEAVERVRALVRSVPSGYSDLAGRLAEELAPKRPAEAVAVWADLPAEQQHLSQEFFFRFLGNPIQRRRCSVWRPWMKSPK